MKSVILSILFSFLISLAPLYITEPLTYAQPFGLRSSTEQKEARFHILSTKNGRYIFGQISDSHKDKFMLDTLTGRLWQIAESGEVGLYLRPVPYRYGNGKYGNLPERPKR